MAFKKARAIKADFAINGGDHVFDSLAVPTKRAVTLFDLYDKTEQDLGVKVHHTSGNHDVCGVYPASGLSEDDPLYGKKLFEQRFGKLYYSFDHKGHHFIVLDSIGITNDSAYEGRIEAAQVAWRPPRRAARGPSGYRVDSYSVGDGLPGVYAGDAGSSAAPQPQCRQRESGARPLRR